MIIRLSLGDNDYSEELEKFATNLYTKVSILTDKICKETDDRDVKIKEHHNWERTFELFNPNCTTEANLNDEDKSWLSERIQLAFDYWVKGRVEDGWVDADEAGYLLGKDLQVTVGFDFKDKWENGEAVYYFTTANVIINQ